MFFIPNTLKVLHTVTRTVKSYSEILLHILYELIFFDSMKIFFFGISDYFIFLYLDKIKGFSELFTHKNDRAQT